MKKVKLSFDFLSAADKMFSSIAVLFTPVIATTPVAIRIPYYPRR
jgi:hypothetical protein